MTEAEWLAATDPQSLWACVSSEMAFGPTFENRPEESTGNLRLAYLPAVGACRRIVTLACHPSCERLLLAAERLADGVASLDELGDAQDEVADLRDRPDTALLPAADAAAIQAIFWLSPDEYKLNRALEHSVDVRGYLRAASMGKLSAHTNLQAAQSVWNDSDFLAGKHEEEHALSD
jgi:hypothetical protein